MSCTRVETDGMRFLDGEMSAQEKDGYQAHVRSCTDCAGALKSFGRVVGFTDELRLRAPDESFWDDYWSGIHRRLERGIGFIMLIVGLITVTGWGVFHAVTSPQFFTIQGLSITAILLGLVVVFVSVVRERYHEQKSDPYKEVKQ